MSVDAGVEEKMSEHGDAASSERLAWRAPRRLFPVIHARAERF
jgi:hypothetical protein